MDHKNVFVGNLTKEITKIINPLKDAFSDAAEFQSLLLELGWETNNLPSSLLVDINNKIDNILTAFGNLTSGSKEIEYINILKSVKDLYGIVQSDIASIADTLFSPLEASLKSKFVEELPYRLMELLIVKYLKVHQPKIYTFLQLIKVIQFESVESLDDSQPYFIRQKINFQNLINLIRNPTDLLRLNYNSIDFIFEEFAFLLLGFFGKRSIPATLFQTFAGEFDEYKNSFEDGKNLNLHKGIEITVASLKVLSDYKALNLKIFNAVAENVTDSGLLLALDIPSGLSLTHKINDNFDLKIDFSAAFGDSLAFLITPNKLDFKLVGSPETSLPPIGLNARLEYKPDEAKMIFGKEDGTKLVLKNAGIGLGAKYVGTELELIIEGDLSGLIFTLDTGDGDSFINNVLGKGKKEINLPLAIQWSSKHGITFKGVGAFEIAFNPNIDIAKGTVKVQGLRLALRAPKDSDTLSAEVRASFSGDLGFMKFVVDEIGLRFNIKTTEGNLGPIGIDLGFAPPKGIGLTVDSGQLTGGGFLSIDPEKGRYVGALQLSLLDKFDLTAIAIITTKAPDGSEGFSLLAMLNVAFQPSIQLGLGFSLSGLGGLLAVNRRMSAEAIRLGVKSGAIDRILFPDPKTFIENVPTIVRDLEGIFPTQKGRYVFGIFFLINWGVSDELKVLDIKLGILAEFPSPIKLAIIGTLSMKLPDKKEPVIILNVAFAGFIDFEKKYLSFDASIYDSKLLAFSLSGDIAVRLFWGNRSELLLSVGGFHPAYTAPSDLALPPKMERMTIMLLDNGVLSLKMMNYFAITSNTAQFGARIELLLNVKAFRVIGLLGLDVLFQFNPFKLQAQIEAMLAVFSGKRELLSVAVRANLEGPGPWHAWGRGEFKVLGIKASANFDETWGPAPKTTVPEIAVAPLVEEALREESAWKTVISNKKKETVTFKNIESVFILHPAGQLSIGQKIAPLGVKLSRYGTQKISDGGLYNISEVKIADEVQITQSELEQFAPANYRDMNDGQKLKAASFEYLRSGVKVNMPSSSDLHMDTYILKEVKYDMVLIDKLHTAPKDIMEFGSLMVNEFVSGGVIGTSDLGAHFKKETNHPIVNVSAQQEKYKIVSKDTLEELGTISPGLGSTVSNSLADVNTLLENILKSKPGLAGKIQTVPA